MRLGALVMLPLCAFLFVSCQRGGELNDIQKDTVIHGVQQAAVQLFDDLRTHNIASLVAAFDSSDAFFWIVPPDTTAITRDALAALHREELDTYTSIEARWLSLRVEPISATLAAYTGLFEVATVSHAGDTSTRRGIETGVMILRDGTWKFLNGQTTFLDEGNWP